MFARRSLIQEGLRAGMTHEAVKQLVQSRLRFDVILDRIENAARAEERARRDLLRALTPYQRHTLVVYGFIPVRGNQSRTAYEIRGNKFLGNILDRRGGWKFCLCLHDRSYPRSVHLLAQKLTIENDEARFLEMANVTRIED